MLVLEAAVNLCTSSLRGSYYVMKMKEVRLCLCFWLDASTRGRLWFLENSVSNVTDLLTVSHQINKGNVDTYCISPLQQISQDGHDNFSVPETAKDLRRLQFAVDRNKEELNSGYIQTHTSLPCL